MNMMSWNTAKPRKQHPALRALVRAINILHHAECAERPKPKRFKRPTLKPRRMPVTWRSA